MARGLYQINDRITTNADTTLVAAPSSNAGLPERINIRWLTITVEAAGTGSLIRIEDGVGGDVIATLDTSDDNNRIERAYHVKPPSKGRALSTNTLLNAETTGSAAATVVVEGEVEVS